MPEKHAFRLDERRHAVITGVTDVSSFDENEIVLRVEGSQLVIGGEGLHVGRLLLEEGRVDVEGRIDSLAYEPSKSPAVRFGLFKKG